MPWNVSELFPNLNSHTHTNTHTRIHYACMYVCMYVYTYMYMFVVSQIKLRSQDSQLPLNYQVNYTTIYHYLVPLLFLQEDSYFPVSLKSSLTCQANEIQGMGCETLLYGNVKKQCMIHLLLFFPLPMTTVLSTYTSK